MTNTARLSIPFTLYYCKGEALRSQGQTANRLRSSSFLSGDIQMDTIPVVGEGGKGQLLLSAHFPRRAPLPALACVVPGEPQHLAENC